MEIAVKKPHVLALVLLVGGLGLQLGACAAPVNTESGQTAPVRGKVTDLASFGQFIATRPTPLQFRSRYPDVVLVLPGEIATKEMRMDNSRYFAELDGEGRIQSGRFM
jgi:hypothetical protein